MLSILLRNLRNLFYKNDFDYIRDCLEDKPLFDIFLMRGIDCDGEVFEFLAVRTSIQGHVAFRYPRRFWVSEQKIPKGDRGVCIVRKVGRDDPIFTSGEF